MKMDAGKWFLALMALAFTLLAIVPLPLNQALIVACGGLAIGSFGYVFSAPDVEAAPTKDRLAYLHERKEVVYENLRDLNFELKAGKMPESDYEQMRASLEDEAVALLAEIERGPQSIRTMSFRTSKSSWRNRH